MIGWAMAHLAHPAKPALILSALIFFNGTASRNLVEEHIMVNRYNLFPDFILGNGTTQSMITLLNGSSMASIGISGAT